MRLSRRGKISAELRNARILLIGYGRIGRRTAELLSAFGARILVCDPYIEAASLNDGGLVSLEEGLPGADVISLHAAGETCILGATEFSDEARSHATEFSRGNLVDEAALVHAWMTER